MKAPKYEGSAADRANDKREAKKRGLTMAQWEKTAADKRMDAAGQRALLKKARAKRVKR